MTDFKKSSFDSQTTYVFLWRHATASG